MSWFEDAELVGVARPQPRRRQREGLTVPERLGAQDDDMDNIWRALIALRRAQQNTNRILALMLLTLIGVLIAALVDVTMRIDQGGGIEELVSFVGGLT